MDDYLHGAGVGTQEAGINLNEVANLDGPVEANAAGIHGHGVFPGPFHRAGGGGFVDPSIAVPPWTLPPQFTSMGLAKIS